MKVIKLAKNGWFVTSIYFLAISCFYLFNKKYFVGMRPNEWGDLLAGITTPIALLWLIVGYNLQRKELKQNTEALGLQSRELKHSVEEQRKLVKESVVQTKCAQNILKNDNDRRSEESLQLKNKYKSHFYDHGVGYSLSWCQIKIRYYGELLSRLSVTLDDSLFKITSQGSSYTKETKTGLIDIKVNSVNDSDSLNNRELKFRLFYVDFLGNEFSRIIKWKKGDQMLFKKSLRYLNGEL